MRLLLFFFNDTATTEIYTLSLHDALPISCTRSAWCSTSCSPAGGRSSRSEEHTSELQSHHDLVCRLLLEKKKAPNLSRLSPYHTLTNTEILKNRFSVRLTLPK